MAYIQQNPVLCCDACDSVLNGQDRAAFQTKNYLKIQGTFHFEVYIPEAQRYVFKKITKDGSEELHFCNWECLKGYAEGRIRQFDEGLKAGRFLVRGVNEGAFKMAHPSPVMERSPYGSIDRSNEEEY